MGMTSRWRSWGPPPSPGFVDKVANRSAELITRFNDVTEAGGVIKRVVWRMRRPVLPTNEGCKYRTVHFVAGVRVIDFDTEQVK